MLAGRVTPDVTSYNALISACEKGGEWQRALHLFQLCRSELQPNLVSYNAMISACQKGLAVATGRFISKSQMDPNGEFIIWRFFYVVFMGKWLLKPGVLFNPLPWRQLEALKIFNSIPEAKLRPNLVTYSAVISSLEKSRALWATGAAFFPAIEGQQLVSRRHQLQRHHQLLWSCRGVAASLEFAPQHGG